MLHQSREWVTDMHALSVKESWMEFGPNDCRVVLKPKKDYVPKDLSTPFGAQVITLSASAPREPAVGDALPSQLLCRPCTVFF